MLASLGAEFRMAQIGLDKSIEDHGMSSDEAVACARLCSTIALHFSEAEEEFLAVKEHFEYLHGKMVPF
ncbi:hypothetical protein D1646_08110 [Pseudoflavonifractor sp. 60]|nr:hypothetical protein [Pseudoflavonifractor sp. 60]